MSLFDEESIGDRLIEDYLSNFQSVRDDDHQFARPIEDEDIFGLDPVEQQSKDSCPEPPTPVITAKSKLEQFKQSIKDKLLAKGIVPKPLENGRNKDDLIEIVAGQAPDGPVPPARLIFQHAQEKNVKDKYGLYKGQKLKWNAYSDHLKKSICSDKRKQWDSFALPVDDYDDEEELVETVEDTEEGEKDDDGEERVESEDGEDHDEDDDDNDNDDESEKSEDEDGDVEVESESGDVDEDEGEANGEEMGLEVEEEDEAME